MSSGFKKSLLTLSLTGLLVAPAAHATNGYFAHGYSTKEKGLAGAGNAYSQDSLAAANNPAGMVHVGNRMDIGAAIFNPNRQYTTGNPGGAATFPLAPGTYESNHDYFLIPSFGWNMMLDDTSSFGVSVYGNGGMNTNYPNVPGPGTFGGGDAGVNLSQLFINASYAKKINDKHSVGASLIFAYQMFKADGLAAFGGLGFSTDPTKLSNNGDDTSTGFGAKFGWQGQVMPTVALGVSYQTKMSMSEFDDYAGLFAEDGDFDIPATLTLGAAWDINDKSKLVVDVQTIYYSDVPAIANPFSNLGLGADGQLGGPQGAGFGWDDMTVVKVGYEWLQNDMTWRVGLSNGSQPIPESEVLFNILAPGVMETHLTFGFTMPMGESSDLDFAFMYAPANDVSGVNPNGDGQTIELEMDQMEVAVSYAMKF